MALASKSKGLQPGLHEVHYVGGVEYYCMACAGFGTGGSQRGLIS